MRYYFIAGEASGDLHAANCMREIKKLDAGAEFAFTGGNLMEEVSGVKPCIHIRQMAFMGFAEVLKNIRTIQKNFKLIKNDILRFKPDVLVLVDYPGFNLRMAEWATARGIKTDYYISPTVWAWKENRVEKIKKFTNKLFVILPFEEAFYQKHQHKVYFTGHPLIDAIAQKRRQFKSRQEFLSSNGLDERPLVAVLPGSRAQEIERMLQVMLEVSKDFNDCQFVFAGSDTVSPTYYAGLAQHKVKVVFGQTYELMAYAQAGIIKSGTSTLESALLRLPQVVCYKTGAVSFAIGKRLVKVKYISLPNLVLDKEVVRELVQNDFTVENIRAELKKLLYDAAYRQRILQDYDAVEKQLGGIGASARVAAHVFADAGGGKP